MPEENGSVDSQEQVVNNQETAPPKSKKWIWWVLGIIILGAIFYLVFIIFTQGYRKGISEQAQTQIDMQNQGITTPGEPGNPSEVVEDRTTSTTPTMPTTKSPVTQDPTTTTTREEDKNISLNLSIGNDTSSKVTISIKINGNEVYNNGINGSNTGTPVLDSKSISIAQGEFTILVADSVGRTTTKKLNTKDGNYISVLSGLKDININQSNEPFQYL